MFRLNLPFLFDILFLTIFLVFVTTQILIPLWRDVKLFPWWSRRRQEATRAVTEAREKEDIAAIRRKKD